MKKYISVVLVVMLIFAAMTGCGAKKADEISSVKISAINTVSWAPVFIAQTEGFFKEQGLEVEFTTPGGPKGFQAMHAGDVELCMLSQEPLLIAQEQGMKSSIIGTMFNSRIYGLISTKDITDVSQLKGKVIFGSDAGSAPYTFVCSVLEEGGLDPLNDVSFVQVADQMAGMQALVNGEVAAAFVNMSNLPVIGDFEYNVLADTSTPEGSAKYLGSEEFPGEMICTTTAFAKDHPEVCQKVMNAVIKAQGWIASHSDAEVAKSLHTVFGSLEENIIAEEIAFCRDVYSSDCMVTEAGQQAVIDVCMKAGLIKTNIPYGDVVDMTFVKNYKK